MSTEVPTQMDRLGAVLAVYAPARRFRIGVPVLGAVMALYLGIVLSIGGFLLLRPPTQPRELAAGWGLFAGAMLLLLVGSVTLLLYWRWLGHRVLLCEDGVALWSPAKATSVPWDEVRAVRPKITKVYRHGVLIGMRYRYTVRLRDGSQVQLTDFFDDIQEVGERLQEEAHRRQA